MRINSAKDDAAGLQIADRLTTQINGLNQGNRNTNDGIALAQTIESGMDEMSGMLQKIRTLAVQSANGTNTAEDRAALKKEGDSLMNEITRIAKQTKFGGKTVLNGYQANNGSIFQSKAGGNNVDASKAGTITLQVGANKDDEIAFKVENFAFCFVASRAGVDNIKGWTKDKGLTLSTASGAKDTIALMDAMISQVDTQRSDLGAIQNHINALKKIKKTKCL